MLYGVLEPSSANNPLTKHQINLRLSEAAYAKLFVHQDAIDTCVEQSSSNNPFRILLAERRDGAFSLEVSGDKLIVTAQISPAYGGEPVTEDEILSALTAEGVSSGRIDLGSLELAANADKEISVKLAKGLRPVKGSDARFVSLVVGVTAVPVLLDDDNLVDYFDQWAYTSVATGTPLMKRIPPTTGIEGVNVLGARLAAKPGKNIKFQKYKGASIDPDDENVLVAARDGHPIIEPRGVAIDDMLVLPQASIDTGHIDFDGSVAINGDVHSQVIIKASGDIFVKGTVSNARLEAAHDLVIGGGVLSQAGPGMEDDSLLITSRLTAGNSIQALFLNQTVANSGNTIDIQRYVMNCELRARETISLGQSGGKGAIIGGQSSAAFGITANVTGSNAYVETELCCKPSSHVVDVKKDLVREMEKRHIEIRELQAIARKLNEAQAVEEVVDPAVHQKLLKIVRTIKALRSRAELMAQKIQEIADYLLKSESAFIHIDRKAFPNTVLEIGSAKKLLESERRQTHAVCRKGEIVIS